MRQITVTEFTAAMEAAVEERGREYVYPPQAHEGEADDYHSNEGDCMYTKPDGTPACLIGVALALLGITHETVEELEYGNAIGAGTLIERMRAFGIEVAPEVIYPAELAQCHQDRGGSWGGSLDRFKGEFDRYSTGPKN